MRNAALAHALENQDRWGYIGPGEEKFFKSQQIRVIEPLVHEVCHAVSLGMKVTKLVPDKVSDYFSDINDRSLQLGLATEAHCFAIERNLLYALGWIRYVRFAALMKDVWETGYSGPSLPWKTFMQVYRQCVRAERGKDTTNVVIYHLHKIGGFSEKQAHVDARTITR